MIPYGKQDITQEDIDMVVAVLKSDFITQGPMVPEFERLVAKYCKSKGAVAVNSATSALHIACLALDLAPDDWLWTSPNTFVASANCGVYCGAKVDFVDIDPRTYNLCPVKLEEKLTEAAIKGNLPRVIVAVHFAGQSCEMRRIHELSKEYGISVIEDASHSIGGRYLSNPIGCCKYSDITIFSFHPVKIITTAEGGIATANNPVLLERMRLLRNHGLTRDRSHMQHEPDGEWYYEQVALGFNYRMTEMQAALGISQMSRLDAFVEKRHVLAEYYSNKIKMLPLILPMQHQDCYSALHLYPVLIDAEKTNKTRKQVFHHLREKGVGVNVHYIPVHTQPFYQSMGFTHGNFPVSEKYYARSISLPLFYGMSDSQQDFVIEQLYNVFCQKFGIL